jgi:hypothetical protein
MNVAPSAVYEAVIDVGTTGLVGTIGLRVNDNLGTTVTAFDDTNIDEIADGVYAANTRTAPGTAGQYTLIWTQGVSGTMLGVEDLLVTTEATSAVIGSGTLYVTRVQLKTMRGTAAESFDDAAIDVAVESASRSIDGYKNARYYPTIETRYYTNWYSREASLPIDDLVTLTSLLLDTDRDGIYELALVEGTDFVLSPRNAPLEGRPYNAVTLLPVAHRRFPTDPDAIKITGSFGWAAAPGQVSQAAILLANRFLVRMEKAPLGILVAAAADAVAMARLGGIDPDAAFLLDQLPNRRPGVVSAQLG